MVLAMNMMDTSNLTPPDPFPGVGESGRPRRTWNAEIVGSNPTALTTQNLPELFARAKALALTCEPRAMLAAVLQQR